MRKKVRKPEITCVISRTPQNLLIYRVSVSELFSGSRKVYPSAKMNQIRHISPKRRTAALTGAKNSRKNENLEKTKNTCPIIFLTLQYIRKSTTSKKTRGVNHICHFEAQYTPKWAKIDVKWPFPGAFPAGNSAINSPKCRNVDSYT